jgi:NADH-quinone oxidoreductase chain I
MVRYLADIYQAVSSTLKGMGITIKHIWRKPVTQQYPDERWMLPDRFKGFVFNDINRCNACNQCVKACPVSCIYLETEGKGKDRWMTRYAIDYNKCIWCGFCVEPCPDDALSMSHDYDHSVYMRDRFVYEFVPPDKPVPCDRATREEMGYWVKPKPEKKERPEKAEKAARPEKAEKPEKPARAEKADGPAAETPAAAPAAPPEETAVVDERPASAPDLPWAREKKGPDPAAGEPAAPDAEDEVPECE